MKNIDSLSKEIFPLITNNRLVSLNPYNTLYSQVSPVICKELIELNRHRYTNIYLLGNDGKSAFIFDGVGPPTIDITKIKTYKSSAIQIDKLIESKYYLQENRKLMIRHGDYKYIYRRCGGCGNNMCGYEGA